MRSSFLFIAACFCAVSNLSAQEQKSEVITVGADKFLRWYGHAGRTYFIQVSDSNDHLNKWTWAPIIESGNDEDISYEVDGTADKGFYRLWFTDEFAFDPDNGDFDSDGLSNWDEVNTYQTNPLRTDSDGDWMWDDYELANNLDPTDAANGMFDADGDGLANQLEFVFMDQGYDAFVMNNAAAFPWLADPDFDGVNTQVEFVTYLTNPRQPDTDGDGLGDGWEIAHGFNAKFDNSKGELANHHPDADADGDGLSNAREEQLGTNPFAADSDSDGVSDGDEENQGSNPNDPNDNQLPPNGTVAVNITFGDPSYSNSEKYRVQLTPLEGDAGGVRFRTNRKYGVPQTDTFRLPKGAKYKVELMHIGTNPKYRGDPRPDYDYQLEIDTSAGCLVLEDPDGIITSFNGDSDEFYAEGKNATLRVPLFEWVTPKASPVSAPDDAGDGQNEFTYDAAAPGVLTIETKVLVKPTGTAGVTGHDGVKFSDRCSYKMPTINGATFAWDEANPGGKSAASGEHLIAKATYTTLPELNSEFGLKQAEFECNGHVDTLPKGDFEVFFMKNEKNHPEVGPYPGPRPPNWYYYWAQTAANKLNTTTEYIGALRSHYDYFNARTIKLGDDASRTSIAAWGTPKGIDCYGWATAHEAKHHTQLTGFWPTNWDGALDADRDFLPDTLEGTYMPRRNYDPTKVATFPDTIGYGQNPLPDAEDINMRSQTAPYGLDQLWTNGSANNLDWANPGKNSVTKF